MLEGLNHILSSLKLHPKAPNGRTKKLRFPFKPQNIETYEERKRFVVKLSKLISVILFHIPDKNYFVSASYENEAFIIEITSDCKPLNEYLVLYLKKEGFNTPTSLGKYFGICNLIGYTLYTSYCYYNLSVVFVPDPSKYYENITKLINTIITNSYNNTKYPKIQPIVKKCTLILILSLINFGICPEIAVLIGKFLYNTRYEINTWNV